VGVIFFLIVFMKSELDNGAPKSYMKIQNRNGSKNKINMTKNGCSSLKLTLDTDLIKRVNFLSSVSRKECST